jgi:UTP--glucose-1-phosphate uridylyltransferase
MLPATKSQPKEMLPVGKKPIVQYVVEELVRNGLEQVLFITGKNKASIENHFDFDHELMRSLREGGKEELLAELEYERLRVHFFYTRQRRQCGLGDAILCAERFAGQEPFVVALGDSIIGLHATSLCVRKMIEAFEAERPSALIAVEEVGAEMLPHYGVVKPQAVGELFQIEDLVEKPGAEQAPSRLAIAGRYILSPAIFDALRRTAPDKYGEIQLTDAIRILCGEGHRVMGLRLSEQERRYDIGNFDSYFQAFVEFALADPEHGRALRQHILAVLERDQPAEGTPAASAARSER